MTATEYDFSKAHFALTRWLHHEYCHSTGCQDKGINDLMCRDTRFHGQAAFMIAAIAPHFINEIMSGGTQVESAPCCVDVL